MSEVNFTFLSPDGLPWAGLHICARPKDAFYDPDEPGIVVPRSVETVTNEEGKATLNLRHSTEPYSLRISGEGECPVAEFEFMVPNSETPLNFQDLLV